MRGGLGLSYKSDWVIVVPLRVKIRGLVLLRVRKSKITSASGIVVPFRALNPKKLEESKC